MAICLNEESVKMVGNYFGRKIPTFVNKAKSYEELVKMIYDEALKDFKGKDIARESGLKMEEIIGQHMTVLPFILSDYFAKPENNIPELNKRVIDEKQNVFNALKEDAAPEALNDVLSDYSKMVSGKPITIAKGSTQRRGGDIAPGYYAINFNLNVIRGQFSMTATDRKFRANIDDPAFAYHTGAIRSVLADDNKAGYQFQLMQLSELENLDGYTYKGVLTKADTPLLVIVDRNGSIVRFDERGNVDKTGNFPVFDVHKFPSQFGVNKAMTKINDARPDKAGLSIAQKKRNYLISKGIDPVVAAQQVVDEVATYIEHMNSAIKRMNAGEKVYFRIDTEKSSSGMTEINDMSPTNLNEIKNWNTDVFGIRIVGRGLHQRAILNIPNARDSRNIERRPLKDLSEQDMNTLMELLTNNNLKDNTGRTLSKKVREQYLGVFLELAKTSNIPIKISWSKERKNEITAIQLGTEKYTISTSAVKAETAQKNKEAFIEGFNAWIDRYHGIEYFGEKPTNYEVVTSLDKVEQHGQVYEPVPGKLMKAIKPSISANLGRKVQPSDTFQYPIGITEEGTVETETRTFAEHIFNTGMTNVIPNMNGEIKGSSPYLAFDMVDNGSAENDAGLLSDLEDFMTLAEENKSSEKLVRGEEKNVMKWFEESGWNELKKRGRLHLILSDKVHEKGPGYVASFFRDTISLWKGSDRTSIYHEVLHAWADGILTPEEKAQMIQEIRDEFGDKEFTVIVYGKTKVRKFSEATVLEIEEWLAEEFRAYARNRSIYNEKKNKSRVRRFFDRIVEILEKMFGLTRAYPEMSADAVSSARIQQIFNDLYEGNIDFSKFKPSTTEHQKYQSRTEGLTDFTYQEEYTTMSSMTSLLSFFLDNVVSPTSKPETRAKLANLAIKTSKVASNTEKGKKLLAEYKAEMEKLSRLDAMEGLGGRGAGMYVLENEPLLMQSAVDYIKNRFERLQKAGVLDEEDQALVDKIVRNLEDKVEKDEEGNVTSTTPGLITTFFNEHTTLNLQEDVAANLFNEEHDETVANGEWAFDRQGNEYDIADTVDARTKELLSSLFDFERQGEGSKLTNSLGFRKLVPFQRALIKVLRITDGMITREQMYNALQNAAQKDQIIRQLMKKLGDINNATSLVEQMQWARFWHSTAKATIRLRTLTMEKTENEETGEVRLLAKSGKSKLTEALVRNGWAHQFRLMAQDTLDETTFFKTLKVNNIPMRVLDIERLLEWANTPVYKIESASQAVGNAFYHEKMDDKDVAYNKRPISRYEADPAEFLRALGINIPSTLEINNVLNHGSSDTYGVDRSFIPMLIRNLELRVNPNILTTGARPLSELGNVFMSFQYQDKVTNEYDQSNDIRGYLDRLARFASEFNDEYTTFMSWTPAGEKQSEKSFHSSVSVILAHINSANHVDDVLNTPGLEHFNYEHNPILAANKTFRQMFQLDHTDEKKRGVRNKEISFVFENVVGSKVKYKNEEAGVKSIKSDIHTKFATEFYHTLIGRQEIPRSEAKSSSYTFFGPIWKEGASGELRKGLYFNNEEILEIFQSGYAGRILYNEFAGFIEAELVRMHRIENLNDQIDGLAEGETVLFDDKFRKRGNKFVIFETILSDETQAELKKLGVTESFTMKDKISDQLIQAIEMDIKAYFTDRATKLFDEFNDELVMADDILENFAIEEEELEESIRERLFKIVAVNSYLNYLNYTSMFLGDPAIYDIAGEGFHKRIAGAVSTGTIFLADQAWYDFVNDPENGFEKDGFAMKHFDEMSPERREELKKMGRNTTFQRQQYEGYLNTAVIAEAKSSSVYYDHYANVLGINNQDNYLDMEEADGAAWISFDMYRLLSLSANEWSTQQEDLYQALLRGEEIDDLNLKGSFPIRKYQYYGPLFNKLLEALGLSTMAFHKYSLVPLIPNVIEETPLQKLHERMMEEGIDYVVMESASKLSTLKRINKDGAIDNNIYDVKAGRIITEEAFVNNRIHVKHLKSQVHMAEGFKGKITLFSQMRKMVYLGVMNNGVPTDFMVGSKKSHTVKKKAWRELENDYRAGKKSIEDIKKVSIKGAWSLEYEETMELFQNELREELLSDLGLTEKVTTKKVGKETITERSYEGSTKKLLSYIQRELKSKDLLPEEIEGLINPTTGEMISDLSLNPNSSKIEEILTTLVDKRLRAIKVNGEGFIQQSGAMMEKSGSPQFTLPAKELLHTVGTNGLRTYYGKKADGTIATDKDSIDHIQFMDVKIALQGSFKHLLNLSYKGEPIRQYENGKFNFKASLNKLNEALRDDEFFEEHKALVTLTGPRIPTQAFASLEAAYVREFLHPMADKTIILPSEIVAKAGSDFDIDKLYLMYPNLATYNGKVEIIKYNPENKDKKEELRQDIKDAQEMIEVYDADLDRIYADKEKLYNRFNNPELKELYEKRKELRLKRQLVMDDATEAYNQTGKYKGWTNSESNDYHRTVTSPLINRYNNEIDFITDRIDEINAELEKKLAETFGEDNKGRQEITDKFNKLEAEAEKFRNWKKEAQEEIDDNQRKLDGITTKGIENRLIDLFTQRIGHPDALRSLVEPNSTDFFFSKDKKGNPIGIAEELRRRLEEKRVYKKLNNGTKGMRTTDQGMSGSSAFDLHFNLIKHQENSVGLDALGIAAVVSTYYAMFTKMGATLKGADAATQKKYQEMLEIIANPGKYSSAQRGKALQFVNKYRDYQLKFDHNNVTIEGSKRIALGLVNNVEGKNISDVIGQLINGFVDVAANPWIFSVQGTLENTPQMLMMIMAGVPTDVIAKFNSLPMVIEYNEIKAKMKGAFANVNKEFGESPVKEGIGLINDARAEMFRRHSKLIKEGMARTVQSHEYRNIANSVTHMKEADLDRMLDNPNSFEEFKAFTHYLQIEDISRQLTEFTQVTKFDTQKLRNLSDPEARQERIKSNKEKESAIPREWYDQFDQSVVGLLNNDRLVLEIFSRHFALRNNPILVRMSSMVQNTEQTKGRDISLIRKLYKDLFIAFVYQNSIFKDNFYGKYQLFFEEDPNLNTAVDIIWSENKVLYNSAEIKEQKDAVSAVFGHDIFPTDAHYIRYEIERALAAEDIEKLSDEELLDKYYYVASLSPKQNAPYTRTFVSMLLGVYNSTNNVAMFRKGIGYTSLFGNIIAKHKSLYDRYALVQNLKVSYDEDTGSSNFFLPDISDPDMLRIYRENLQELLTNPNPEVRDFFEKFIDYALLQTGMERGSSFDLVRIVTDQSRFHRVINERGLNAQGALVDELSRASELLQSGKSVEKILKEDVPILKMFETQYNKIVNSALVNKRNRGINLMMPGVADRKQGQMETEIAGNNVVAFNSFAGHQTKSRGEGDGMFVIENVSELYDENLNLDYEYMEKLAKASKVGIIAGSKYIAPSGKSQTELDDALMNILGLDNTGDRVIIKMKAKGETADNLSIALAKKQNHKLSIKDEFLANMSTKAIARSTEGGKENADSSSWYIDAISERKANRIAGNRARFGQKDTVWIFGTGISKNIAGNYTIKEWEAKVKDTFDSYYKPHIAKAVDSGVTRFLIGSNSGTDVYARELLEREHGFYAFPRYTPHGKYFEVVKMETYQAKEDDIVKLGAPSVMIGNTNYTKGEEFLILKADFIIDEETRKKVNGMSIQEREDGTARNLVVASIASKVKELNEPLRTNPSEITFQQFISKLIGSEGAPLVVNNTFTDTYNALVEEVLMETRAKYVAKNKADEKNRQRKAERVQAMTSTFTGNVKQFPSAVMKRADGTKALDYAGMLDYAKKNNGIYPLRQPGTIHHFGNPFAAKRTGRKMPYGVVKEMPSIVEASIAYYEWLTTDKYDAEFPGLLPRKNWINSVIDSGRLKGKTIFYFTERYSITHANVLDHLINNNQPLVKEEVDKLKPC